LLTVNNEAKVRRSTKSLVLGKAKVMGYEELVEAREKRAEKEAAWKVRGKGKRGRKRTSAAPEADAEKPKTKATRVTKKSKSATTMNAVVQMDGIVVAQVEVAPAPWTAPVARMY
jgi:hypothetical protein